MSSIDVTEEQRLLVNRTIDEVRLQRVTRAVEGGQASLTRGDPTCPPGAPFREAHQYFDAWNPVMRALAGDDKPPPLPPPAVTQLGPFQTGAITFNNGVPVGGWASLVLRSDGSYTFAGHYHDSGATSYNVQFAWAFADGAGHAYTFAKNGHVAGTFESGSRDFDWNESGTNPALAAGFASLSQQYHWQWNGAANWDATALLNSIIEAIKTAGFVVSTIIAIV